LAAIEREDVGPMSTLVTTQDVESLAPMPASVARLAAIVADDTAGVADIAKVISFDQALTANVLRMANSVWSSSQNPIATVKDAVVRIGGARVLSLVVGGRLSGPLGKACIGYELEEHELWRHSVAAALATERLGQYAKCKVPGAAFTGALIHDIGKLLLNRHLESSVIAAIRQIVDEEKVVYVEAERRVLGTDHAAAGAAVVQHWAFPQELVDAVANHHDPDANANSVLDAVHVGNIVAKLIGVGLGTEQMNMNASQEVPKRIALSARNLESLCATVKDELARTEAIYGSESHGS
jgi:putative nucleotidyltransferase with HDIG domain